jgi:[acyl-carrier-protein] S-malonyltransferase
MESASVELEAALGSADIADPRFPVIANVSAAPVRTAAEARDLLVRQLTSAVRGSEGIERTRELGAERYVEIGPGTVLTGLLRRIDRSLQAQAVGDLDALRALEGC